MDESPDQKPIANSDVVGAWQYGERRTELFANGDYVVIGPTHREEGTFKITKGTPFCQGRLTSQTGYFLQLDQKPIPGFITVPSLYQIEQVHPDSLVLKLPFKSRADGKERLPFTMLRLSDTTNADS